MLIIYYLSNPNKQHYKFFWGFGSFFYFQLIKYIILDSGQQINWRNKSTICNLFLIVAAVIFCLVMIIIGSIYVDRSLADALSGGNSSSNNDLYLKSLTTGKVKQFHERKYFESLNFRLSWPANTSMVPHHSRGFNHHTFGW